MSNLASFRMLPRQRRLRGLAAQLLDFIFPPTCVTCKQVGSLLCPDCAATIEWVLAPVCNRCGRPSAHSSSHCQDCTRRPAALTQVRSATRYTDPVAAMIHGLKYKNQFALARPLADMMATAWSRWEMPAALVLPVPLHPGRQKSRGYNQAALLAHRFAHAVNRPYRDDLLVRHRQTESQVDLDAAERRRNVANAFKVVDGMDLHRKKILLIDDVYTTGATMEAAAEALLAAGAADVYGYTLARAV